MTKTRTTPENSPATGAPTISGTAQVGETLEVDTSGISDADGLENAAFTYQWLADDVDISGATGYTYTLTDSELGKSVKIEVSFTDDEGNDESLTSAATDAVAAAEPSEPPAKPRGLEATATHGQVVLSWDDPGDDSITGYVILRRVRVNDQGGEFSVLVADTGTAATTYTDDTVEADTDYTYRIKAINRHGESERSRWYHIDTPGASRPQQTDRPDRHGGPRCHHPDLGRPQRRQDHRLRDPAAQPGYRRKGRVHRADGGHGQRRYCLHRRQRGGGDPLHLPHQGHQRARGERAFPLGSHIDTSEPPVQDQPRPDGWGRLR